MKTVKFSNDYEKLPMNWDGTEAVLIAVELRKLEKMQASCPEFIEFDTKYRGKNQHYPLNQKGEYLILVFFHKTSKTLFCTIRRMTEDKYDYYIGSLWETFKMEWFKEKWVSSTTEAGR